MAKRDTKSAPESKGRRRLLDAQLLHYAAMGSVAAEWAWLELWIDFKTLELAKIPLEVGLCITAQVSGSARKLDAYIALARQLGAKQTVRDLTIFAQAMTKLAERRNRIVHDAWVIDKDSHTAVRLEATARKVLQFRTVIVETKDIKSLSAEITAHLNKFDEIHSLVISELSTSP